MLLEKEILIWKDGFGLTEDLTDVKLLTQSDFPKLIFQDFMNQLKLSKLKIGFELNTGTLFEVEPQDLEQIDDIVRLSLTKKHTHKLIDVLTYYLLTEILRTSFENTHIFTNNRPKAELYFVSQIPFSMAENADIPYFVKRIVSELKPVDVKHAVERFFILMGQNYQDKLMLFLTYLDTKYKFKLDKSAFVESTLGHDNFNRVKTKLAQKLQIHV